MTFDKQSNARVERPSHRSRIEIDWYL